MAVEKRDPLPPGRYWVTLHPEEIETWYAWVERNRPNVHVINNEVQTVTPDSFIWAVTPFGEVIKEAKAYWIVFEVKAPVAWIGFGYPTIAGPRIESTTDVIQAPEAEPGVIDRVEATLSATQSLITFGAVLWLGSLVFGRKR
jgi:hypothetical protein